MGQAAHSGVAAAAAGRVSSPADALQGWVVVQQGGPPAVPAAAAQPIQAIDKELLEVLLDMVRRCFVLGQQLITICPVYKL